MSSRFAAERQQGSYNWLVIVAVASFGQFIVAVVIDAAAAMLVFRHADKHGSRHATAWGLFTFLAAIVAIPAYVASYLLRTRRRG